MYVQSFSPPLNFITGVVPRDRRNTPRGRGSRLKILDNSDINSRYQTPVQDSPRGDGFRYGRNWRVGHISPDPSSTEPAPRRHPESKVRCSETSLSQQLYEDRPLLKPIAFVPSKLPSLFLNEEEIFKPMTEEAGRNVVSPSVLKLTLCFQMNRRPAMFQLLTAFFKSSIAII
jgi:hypothetical protein